ncbi:MAG: hypothetical protein WCG83_04405 [Candidatus Peregrinibacteria bacterium]
MKSPQLSSVADQPLARIITAERIPKLHRQHAMREWRNARREYHLFDADDPPQQQLRFALRLSDASHGDGIVRVENMPTSGAGLEEMVARVVDCLALCLRGGSSGGLQILRDGDEGNAPINVHFTLERNRDMHIDRIEGCDPQETTDAISRLLELRGQVRKELLKIRRDTSFFFTGSTSLLG